MSTTSQRLLSGSILRIAVLAANAVVAFLLLPFLVHHLGDRLYGFWALAGTFVGYYGLLDFGLTGTVSQYLSGAIGRQDFKACNLIFNTALRIHSLMGVAALLITFLIALLAHLFIRNPEDASLFWRVLLLVGSTVAINFPLNTFQGLFAAALRFDITSLLGLFTLTLRTCLIIAAVLTHYGLIGVAFATFAASIPGLLLTVWLAKREYHWLRLAHGSWERATTKSLFSYSSYLCIADVADRLRFQLDPVLIASFIGLAAVTHYRVASLFADQYMRLMISLIGVFWPLLSQLHGAGYQDKVAHTFYFATKLSLCAASFLCFGLIAWGRPTIQRWMGISYSDSYAPLVVLTLAMFLDLSQMPTVSLLYATFKHRVYAFSNLAEGLLNLGFSLALVRRYGILGVALGTLVAALLIRVVVQPWWMSTVTDISYSFYVRFALKNAFICAGLVAFSLPLVYWGLKPDYNLLIASAFLATFLFAIGSWALVLNKRERSLFITALKRRVRPQDYAPGTIPAHRDAF